MFLSSTRRPSAVPPASIRFSVVAIALLFIPSLAGAQGRKAIGDPVTREGKKDAETQVEVRFTDQSVLKLTVLEEPHRFQNGIRQTFDSRGRCQTHRVWHADTRRRPEAN